MQIDESFGKRSFRLERNLIMDKTTIRVKEIRQVKDSNIIKNDYEQLEPCQIPQEYYNFSFYVSKERMITYWHQANEILSKKPEKILEVGIGNGIVSSILRAFGLKTVTVDINESLKPDFVASITDLKSSFEEGQYPFVLCARVLQHLPFSEFEKAISQLCHVTSGYLLLTLPVETIRFYFRFRITGKGPVTFSIAFPLFLKRILKKLLKTSIKSKTQNFWKINQNSEVSMANISRILKKYFEIEKTYSVPEDMSHAFFVLRKKQ